MDELTIRPIARIRSDFLEKFTIPRQSGLVRSLRAEVVFEQEYRDMSAVRGLEEFSHLWLIWGFSAVKETRWSPTVRPPRLGGNTRLGVFATRSPFRPNPLALSAVTLAGIEETPAWGTALRVRGADLVDGTPILDIKPYLPYADCRPGAAGGFAAAPEGEALTVDIPPEWLAVVPPERREALRAVLALDPRPRYQEDPDRVYGFGFAGLEVRFTVEGSALQVREVRPTSEKSPF